LLRPWYYEVELLQTGLALFVTVFFIVLVFATGGFGICLCEPFSHNRLGLQSTWLTVGFASPKEMSVRYIKIRNSQWQVPPHY